LIYSLDAEVVGYAYRGSRFHGASRKSCRGNRLQLANLGFLPEVDPQMFQAQDRYHLYAIQCGDEKEIHEGKPWDQV
jgi:hypothetical protein